MDVDKIKNRLKNHIKGMIYGQALGDAAGLQTEFKSKKDKIKVKFPYDEQIRDFPYCDWTDDTDQMILLMEMLIESNHDFYDGTLNEDDVTNFATKLLNWKNQGFPDLGDQCGLGIGGTTSLVLNHSKFLESPIDVSKEIWLNSGKKLAANGALMRTSILSVLNIYKFLREPNIIHQDFYRSIRMMCLVTHYDVRCIISCWMLCYLIQHIWCAIIKNDHQILINLKTHAYKTCMHLIKTVPKNHYPSNQKMDNVRHQPVPANYTEDEYYTENGEYILENELIHLCTLNLEELKLDEIYRIGYTYKCLGCVFWVMDIISKFVSKAEEKSHLSFEKIILKIVSECGDADTNAATAGSLLGAYIGYDELPQKWIEALPHKDWLDAKINRLFEKMNL